jgi:phospholipase C
MAIRAWPAAMLTVLAVLAGVTGADGKETAAPARSHVVLIVLENHGYGEVTGSPEAPYLNRLARRGALATDYHAVAHPSLPNYLALLGGSTFGIDSNCTECAVPGPNLATQLSNAGIAWHAYMEGMPHPCFRGDGAGGYVKRHDPFMYFPSITADLRRCSDVVPTRTLRTDLKRHSLPAFAWIGPNLCYSAHDCNLATADLHLSTLVPRIDRQLGPHGLLIVTFDEGKGNAGCCGEAGGGRVFTVAIGPGVPRGTRLTRGYDHYSLLAGLEDRFGLPRLRKAKQALALPLGSWGR